MISVYNEHNAVNDFCDVCHYYVYKSKSILFDE